MTTIGFRVHINGAMRMFHDIREVAYGMAHNPKKKNKHSKVEVIDERAGQD